LCRPAIPSGSIFLLSKRLLVTFFLTGDSADDEFFWLLYV
jgi:hypothetical protein